MTIGVHDFAIPHERVQPTRDMIVIRLPLPPKMVGSMIIPDVVRDMAQHNVMAGRIVNMGPLAFQYKNGDGLSRQAVKIDDWVVIRPYAGTMVQGGKLTLNSGWRYVSSFQDVLAIIPAEWMPNPDELIWTEEDAQAPVKAAAPPKDDFVESVRERVTYKR